MALPADQCSGSDWLVMQAFCADLSLAPLTHFVRRGPIAYRILCFAVEAHAETFRLRFGGETFDPAWRGRGHSWWKWKEPKAKRYGRG